MYIKLVAAGAGLLMVGIASGAGAATFDFYGSNPWDGTFPTDRASSFALSDDGIGLRRAAGRITADDPGVADRLVWGSGPGVAGTYDERGGIDGAEGADLAMLSLPDAASLDRILFGRAQARDDFALFEDGSPIGGLRAIGNDPARRAAPDGNLMSQLFRLGDRGTAKRTATGTATGTDGNVVIGPVIGPVTVPAMSEAPLPVSLLLLGTAGTGTATGTGKATGTATGTGGNVFTGQVTVAAVSEAPLPASLLLLGTALGGLGLMRRRRTAQARA